MMSDKFQFIQDAINHSLAFENETNRETVERDTEDYIQNEIDTPTSWHWKKEDIANKMKTLQQEQFTALNAFKEDGYNQWLFEYNNLLTDARGEVGKKAQVHFFEIEDILQRIDDRIDKVFDDDEKVYKSDKTELREDLERLTIQTDLLYKTNNNEDWKDAFREALDKVSLFETFVPLDEVFDTKKRMAILADLSDRLDAGDLHTFVEEIEYHQDVIDFSEIHEILDEMRSNLSVSDVFHAHSDREILDLVRHNDNFWQWFETDENREDSLSYRLSMVEDGLPRLFYRGLRDVADEEEIEVGNYEEASYNADYFSSNPKVAGTYISLDKDEYDNTSKIFSGFLRPAENPFVLPCDVHFVHDGWGKPSTANWNNLLEHYNIYEAMCLFEMAGLDNEILKANWDDAFGDMRVTDVETYAYTDAERNDDDEWNKPVKTFVFYKREHSGSLKAYEFIVNEHYTPDDFRGKDGRMPSFVQETELLVSTNDMKANIQAQGKHDRVYFLNCVDVGGGGISDSLNRRESRSIIVAAWHFDPTSYGKSYFKEVRNNGDFDVRDNRIFYSLFDIEQDIRYNLNTQENSEFARAIDDIVNGVEPTGRFIRLGTTPDVWQLIGIPDVKVSIQDDRIQKVMGEYLNLQPHEHSHSHIHNLTPEMVKQLPQQLNEPIAILQSAPTSSNPDGFLVLTELLETDKKTGEEKPVVAALNLVRNRKDNEIRIVNVTTAFGRDNWQTERDINNGLLRYWDKDKGQKFLNTTSLQLLADVTSSSALASRNIKTNKDLMQYRKEKEMSKQSETAFSETPTVIASEPSERGNLHTTENGRLNQEIATPATQVRNDGLNSGSLNQNPTVIASINEVNAWQSPNLESETPSTGSLNNEQPTADKGGFSLDSERQSALNEFFTERDARAFSARWKMQQLLPEILGQAAYQHLSVETLHQIYHEQPDALDHLNENALPQGFYVSDENKVVIIADAFIGREDTAAFTAWHELGHRGINIQGRELWNDWLKEARSNDTVKQIADHTQDLYARQGIKLSDLQATEEAMVDIFAAYKTQQWDKLERRHQLKIHDEFKKPLGTAARLWNAAKEKIGKIFNRQPEKVSDEQIFAMLGKLEQSIYQQPEMAVSERLARGENFTSYFDLNTQPESDFAKAIDEIANGADASKRHITLGTTPDVLTMIGLPETRINIRMDTIQKAMGEYLGLQEHNYSHIHNLTPETLKQIPEQLNNPIAVMKSAQSSSNPNGFVVLTELTETDKKTGKDKPAVAILDLHPTNQGLEVMTVRSVYGRSLMQIEKGLTNDLLYVHTTKGSQFAKDFRLQLPSDALSTANLASRDIKTNKDLMQYRKEKQMENIKEHYYENAPKDAVRYEVYNADMRRAFNETIFQKFEPEKQQFFEFENQKTLAPFEWTKEAMRDWVESCNDDINKATYVDNYELAGAYTIATDYQQQVAKFLGIDEKQVTEFLEVRNTPNDATIEAAQKAVVELYQNNQQKLTQQPTQEDLAIIQYEQNRIETIFPNLSGSLKEQTADKGCFSLDNERQSALLIKLDSQDKSIRRGAASSEYADEAVLRKAFDDKHWQVREDAMRNTRATPELLHEWYQDADPYDKAIILDNPRIGNKTLIDALSDDNDLRYQALYRADKDANREVLHIAEQNSNPEIAQLASQYVSFYEPKIGNKKDPTWLDANLIREDWEHTLNSFNSMQALNETLAVESNLNQEDLLQLANLHQTKPELREKIENLLNESQLHQAINDLKQGQYDQFRQPETLSVIASEQSERGNLLNTENDPLVLDNGKFTQYAFKTKVQDFLRKDFAELIELSKQPENPELVQKQEEVFNLLQSIHHFEKQDLRAMAAVKETNNPVITQLIERAISEPYPHNDWNRQEILSGRLNNPENQNPTVIASEQSERGNLPTTENEQNLSGSLKEPTANNGGLILPENIQNTEFGKQAASVWQSTAENPRKIENTADERSKDISSKHHTYIEALKTDLKDLIETGDFYKASERLGDIRLNQQVFDERIQKAEIQNSLPEQNPTADKGGIVSSTEHNVQTEIDDEMER